jgi:hypothetical protein
VLSILLPPVRIAAKGVEITGWAGFIYAGDDRGATKAGFDAHPLYLAVRSEPAEDWAFFAEIEAEHLFKFEGGAETEGAGELKMERLYIERRFKNHRIRFGKFFLPFGYWYGWHWHFLTETLSRPISFDNGYAPKFQVGIEFQGKVFRKRTELNYTAWVTDGPDQYGTDSRSMEPFGFGGALFVDHYFGAGRRDRIGLTLSHHRQTAVYGASEEYQHNTVVGARARRGRLEARGEVYWHERERSRDTETWYLSGSIWVTRRAAVTYRIDRGDDLKRTIAGGSRDATSQSFGFFWRPIPVVLVKGEYRMNSFESAGVTDYNEWNMFLAIKF